MRRTSATSSSKADVCLHPPCSASAVAYQARGGVLQSHRVNNRRPRSRHCALGKERANSRPRENRVLPCRGSALSMTMGGSCGDDSSMRACTSSRHHGCAAVTTAAAFQHRGSEAGAPRFAIDLRPGWMEDIEGIERIDCGATGAAEDLRRSTVRAMEMVRMVWRVRTVQAVAASRSQPGIPRASADSRRARPAGYSRARTSRAHRSGIR